MFFHANDLEYVFPRRLDDGFQIIREIEPVLLLDVPADERPTPTVSLEQAFLSQDFDRTANRDMRDFELAFELVNGRYLIANLPATGLDPFAHDRGDLQVNG